MPVSFSNANSAFHDGRHLQVWDIPCEPWMPPSPPCSEVDHTDDIYRSIDGLFFYQDDFIAEEDLPPFRESIANTRPFRRLPGSSSRPSTNCSSPVKKQSSSRNSLNENGILVGREGSVEGALEPLNSRLPSTIGNLTVDGLLLHHHPIDVLSPPESSPPTPSSIIYPNEYASSSSVYDAAMISALNGGMNGSTIMQSTAATPPAPFTHPQKSIDESIESVRRGSIRKPLIKYISRNGPPETAHTILKASHKSNEDFVVPEHGMEAPDYEGLPWTCTEDYRLLLAVTREHKLTSELIAENDGLLINWDFVACCVNEDAYHYRSPRQCSLRYLNVILRSEGGGCSPFDSSFKRSRITSSSSTDSTNSSYKRRSHPAPSSIHFDVEQRNQELTCSFRARVEAMAKACGHRKQLVYTPALHPPPTAQQLYSLNGAVLPPHQLQRMRELRVDCEQVMRPLDLLLNRQQQRSTTNTTTHYTPGATPSTTQRLQRPKY